MSKKYILLIAVATLFIVAAACIFCGYILMKNKYKSLVVKNLKQVTGNLKDDILTEDDIKNIPDPVKKYIRYTGAIGKEKVHNFRMTFKGTMKKSEDQPLEMNVNTEQYNFLDTKKRLFYIKAKMYGIPVYGIDSYINGNGNMFIKVAGLFKVSDVKGDEMNISEMITLLNDMCIAAPASLIDDKIIWESIDSSSCKCTFEDSGKKASAILYFNNEGEFINFVTDDRYYTTPDGSEIKVKWSTPIKDYKIINGMKLATYGEAIWHFKDSDFCYAKFNVQSIEYNCSKFK